MEIATKPEQKFIAKQLRKPTGDFAEIIGKKMNHFNEFLYDFVIGLMDIKDNEIILEIGFGNGKFFDKIFSKAENLLVSGIDYSQEMVRSAYDINQSAIESGNLNLKLAESDNIPFNKNLFDKVFCNNVIYFWEEPGRHLREIHQVLKPGGKLYTGFRSKESSRKIPFTEYDFILYEKEEWESILKENSFSVINSKQKSESLIKEDGKPVLLESICCIAEKRN